MLTTARLLYALWALLAFLTVGIVALLLAVLPRRRAPPGGRARVRASVPAGWPRCRLRSSMQSGCRQGQCVVVCNHASYLDGVVLTAALPPRFGFVIKREMAGVPLAGTAAASASARSSSSASTAARAPRMRAGCCAMPPAGIRWCSSPRAPSPARRDCCEFHTGAFVTAARAGCPVVPAVVRGTRRALPPTGGLPRPGRIELEILPPLARRPPAAAEQTVPQLRDRARAAILAALGEPDLTCSDDTDRPPGTAPARSAPASRP